MVAGLIRKSSRGVKKGSVELTGSDSRHDRNTTGCDRGSDMEMKSSGRITSCNVYSVSYVSSNQAR